MFVPTSYIYVHYFLMWPLGMLKNILTRHVIAVRIYSYSTLLLDLSNVRDFFPSTLFFFLNNYRKPEPAPSLILFLH